jgi:hypothetical protein
MIFFLLSTGSISDHEGIRIFHALSLFQITFFFAVLLIALLYPSSNCSLTLPFDVLHNVDCLGHDKQVRFVWKHLLHVRSCCSLPICSCLWQLLGITSCLVSFDCALYAWLSFAG